MARWGDGEQRAHRVNPLAAGALLSLKLRFAPRTLPIVSSCHRVRPFLASWRLGVEFFLRRTLGAAA